MIFEIDQLPERTETTNDPKIERIPIDLVRPSKTNPRKHFPEPYITELAESIRQKGIIQPLTARPDWCMGKTDAEISKLNGKAPAAMFFEIIAGECRYRGATKAALTTVPVIVRTVSDQETLELQLIENLQREDLTPIEEAEGYQRLLDFRDAAGNAIYSADSLSKKVAKSTKTIYAKLKLLNLPSFARKAVEDGTIGERIGEFIGRIPVPEMREKAAREIITPEFQELPLSKRQAQQHIQDHYARSLNGSPFDQADPSLVPPILDDNTGDRLGGGACLDCPMKTGNAQGTFGDVRDPNFCMNPRCYSAKCDALWKGMEASAAIEGKRVLTEKEASLILLVNEHGAVKYAPGYVALSEQPARLEVRPDVKRVPSWKWLVTQAKDANVASPEILLARDGRGKIHELVKRDLVVEAAKLTAQSRGERSIFDLGKPSGSSRSSITGAATNASTRQSSLEKEQKAAKEKSQAKLALVMACMGKLAAAIDKGGLTQPLGFWDALVELAIAHSGHDGHWLVCKRYGLEPKAVKKRAEGSLGHEEALREFGESLDPEFKPGFVVELLLARQLKWTASPNAVGGIRSDKNFKAFAKIYGVNIDEVEKSGKNSATPAKAEPLPANGQSAVKQVPATKLPPPARLSRSELMDAKSAARPLKGSKSKRCSQCSHDALPGKSMCAPCGERNKKRAAERRAKAKKK